MTAVFAVLLACTVGPWAVSATAATEPAPEPGLLHPCRLPGLPQEAQCGHIARPLEPGATTGPRIDIHFAVVPARARNKRPDPVFILAGGPGQSAMSLVPSVASVLSRLSNRRDLVFVDQRGTGRSAPLDCDDRVKGGGERPLADAGDTDKEARRLIDECLPRLKALPYGDLRQFTTSIAVQDLDAVRAALGAGQIDLVGASYGTRVGLEYLRQFPSRVRRLYIDAVAPADMALPASMSVDAQAALEHVFSRCESDAACALRFPALRREWAAVLASLPRRITARQPFSGAEESFELTRVAVLSVVRSALYVPATAASLPTAIHSAAGGDFVPLIGLSGIGLGSHGAAKLSMGMHFSVVCAEDEGVPGQYPVASDFGGEMAAFYARVCSAWPRGAVPPEFRTVSPTPAPVLLTSGGDDPVTPPRHAARVARALGSRAVHVVIPHGAHGALGAGCMRDVLFRFIDAPTDAQALDVDARCIERIPAPPAFVAPGAPEPAASQEPNR